jgi:virulence-associated protein VagC
MMKKTFRVKTFMNGGSQAIRIPAIARFEGDEVELTYDTETELVTIKDIPPKSALTKLIESWKDRPEDNSAEWDEMLAFIQEMKSRPRSEERMKRIEELFK